MSRDDYWRSLPVTAAQMALMDQLCIPYTGSMRRGVASDLITERQEDNPEWDRHPFDLSDSQS